MHSSVESQANGFSRLAYCTGSGQFLASGLTHKWQLHTEPKCIDSSAARLQRHCNWPYHSRRAASE